MKKELYDILVAQTKRMKKTIAKKDAICQKMQCKVFLKEPIIEKKEKKEKQNDGLDENSSEQDLVLCAIEMEHENGNVNTSTNTVREHEWKDYWNQLPPPYDDLL